MPGQSNYFDANAGDDDMGPSGGRRGKKKPREHAASGSLEEEEAISAARVPRQKYIGFIANGLKWGQHLRSGDRTLKIEHQFLGNTIACPPKGASEKWSMLQKLFAAQSIDQS